MASQETHSSPSIPHSIWVTRIEFARMMGKSNQWALDGIHEGLFFAAGIPVLRTFRPSGKGKCQWFLQVPSDL